MTEPTNHDGDGRREGVPTAGRSAEPTWPKVALRYTFNPDIEGLVSSEPDELIVFDPGATGPGDRWITAERGAYVGLDDVR